MQTEYTPHAYRMELPAHCGRLGNPEAVASGAPTAGLPVLLILVRRRLPGASPPRAPPSPHRAFRKEVIARNEQGGLPARDDRPFGTHPERMAHMQDSSTSCAARGSTGPHLATGRRVGKFISEAGTLVWIRNITAKHVFYSRDALTINRGLLRQIQKARVALVRYRLRGVGAYEISLGQFVDEAVLLPGAANGEDVFCVPRSNWRFTPEFGGLTLFAFEGRV